MPLVKLLVEGKLDAEILGTLLPHVIAFAPAVRWVGSKSTIKAICLHENRDNDRSAAYVRDRDFDFTPDEMASGPIPMATGPLGWHWQRHEMENYLLDPQLVQQAFPAISSQAYTAELIAAAKRIRFYEAARWTIGTARRALPPFREFPTRPESVAGHDFMIPDAVGEADCEQWVTMQVSSFRERTDAAMDTDGLARSLAQNTRLFDETFCTHPERTMIWFSGKDLITALQPWLIVSLHRDAPGFRNSVRDWIMAHPDEALAVHAEWRELARLLSTMCQTEVT